MWMEVKINYFAEISLFFLAFSVMNYQPLFITQTFSQKQRLSWKKKQDRIRLHGLMPGRKTHAVGEEAHRLEAKTLSVCVNVKLVKLSCMIKSNKQWSLFVLPRKHRIGKLK